ncbi:MAG: hypothetical protein IPG45_31430 [Deltaproteobacteria bacterium]|jgi:hypothetical protein|nr:hypothetical protein [Deltaproteobacteria bacterium]
MELMARLYPLDDASRAHLLELLDPAPKATSGRFPVSVADPRLPRIMEAVDAAGGVWVSGEAVFLPAELAAATHFEAVCRLVVREMDRDAEVNRATVQRSPPIDAGGFRSIRLVQGLVLSKIRMKPNVIGAIGEASGEYLVGEAVSRALKAAGCTGYTLLPITDPKHDAEWREYHHLYGESLLPPVVADCTIQRIRSPYPEEDGTLRALGCLSYRPEDLDQRPDFNRTAEPWGGHSGAPSWVVSARVPTMFKTLRLRGWAFRPVLVQGSELHRKYLAQWEQLQAIVGRTRNSRFDGGRW